MGLGRFQLVLALVVVTSIYYIISFSGSKSIAPEINQKTSYSDESKTTDVKLKSKNTHENSYDSWQDRSIAEKQNAKLKENSPPGIQTIKAIDKYTYKIQTNHGSIQVDRRDFESDRQFISIVKALESGDLEESQIENAKNYLSLIHEQEEIELSEELTDW